MTTQRSFLLVALPLAVAAVATAQSPNHLVGLTRVNSDLRHVSEVVCAQLAVCTPVGFPSGIGQPPEAGGTAWDSRHSGAWITDGSFLACVDDTCGYLCTPVPVPALPGNVVLTGLEYVDSVGELWATDSAGNLRRYDATACPPTPLPGCAIAFTQPFEVTGLAVDELLGLVFYARYDTLTGTNWLTTALQSAPCAPTQLLPLPPCAAPLGALRGLAVDAGAHRLYATDGERAVHYDYQLTPAGTLLLTGWQCCPMPGGAIDPMVGLAVRPSRATAVGVACTSGFCMACPMAQSTRGDSVLGNADFGIRLESAPPGSFAWAFVGDSPCLPNGFQLPSLCAPVHLPNILGSLGANLVPAGGGCADTVFPLALPSAAGLAGVVMSSQCLVLCPQGPGGFGMSPCLSFELQAN